MAASTAEDKLKVVVDKPMIAVDKNSIGRVCMLMPSKGRCIRTRWTLACV